MAFAAISLIADPAFAAEQITALVMPDPKGLSIPDLSVAPGRYDARHYGEYFYFQKPGVTYERAFADLDQCRINGLSNQIVPKIPRFIPLAEDLPVNPDTVQRPVVTMYGLVGLFLGDILIASVTEDLARITDRKCMSYKGYSRYGTSSSIFDKLDQGSEAEKLARRAVIASGATPAGKALEP